LVDFLHSSPSKKSFEEIGLSDALNGVLSFLNIQRPSKIQAISFRTIYNGTTCMLADQTGQPATPRIADLIHDINMIAGSGKTLAYLLPVFQRLVHLKRSKSIGVVNSREPFVLIITPTTELAK
jgi:superfamily II DNA/RNA helicase